MRYILPADALSKLKTIRNDYQVAAKVDFSKTPSRFGLPLALGGTDFTNRKRQVEFLEKVIAAFETSLLEPEKITTLEQLNNAAEAYRTLVAACLYLNSQIKGSKGHSHLYKLVIKALGFNPKNFLEESDKAACFYAAKRQFIDSDRAFAKANAVLKKAGLQPFSDFEWEGFIDYLKKQTQAQAAANLYPITSVIQPVMGHLFSYSGATAGFLLGEVMSNSTKVMSSKLQLTAMVGTGMIFIGSASSTGVAFIAPAIAAKLIDTYFKISLADIMACIMNIIGQSVGIGIGMSLDLSYRLLCCLCRIIGQSLYSIPKPPQIDGIRISDGAIICGGIVLQLVPVDNLPANYEKEGMRIDDNGVLTVGNRVVGDKDSLKIQHDGTITVENAPDAETIDDEAITAKLNGLPPTVIMELKQQLKKRLPEEEIKASEEIDEEEETCSDTDDGEEHDTSSSADKETPHAIKEHEEAAGVALSP